MKKNSLLLLLFAFAIWGCKKNIFDASSDAPAGKVQTNVTGIVVDENGEFVTGVKIDVGSRSTTTNSDGQFNLAELTVDEDRFYVKASKAGYFDGGSGVLPVKNGVSSITITLLKLPEATVIQSSQASEVPVGEAKISFQPNSFVTVGGAAYNGSVSVQAKLLTPDQPDFVNNIPGRDLVALNNDGSQVGLISFGMIGVELSVPNSTQKLQLASGKTADIQIPIAQKLRSSAPDTIPLWSFDEAIGQWKREGVAQKDPSGLFYKGSVKHFSWWNCDYPVSMATIKGKVLDCNGNPVAGAQVFVNPTDGYDWAYRTTDQYGNYSALLPAAGNWQFTTSSWSFKVKAYGTELNLTKNVTLSNMQPGRVYNIEDLKIAPPSCNSFSFVKGRVINCTNDIPAFYVRVFWGDNFLQGTEPSIVFNNSTTSTLDANFTIAVPSNKPLKVRVATAGYSYDSIIPPLVLGGSLDFGRKEFCVRRPALTTDAASSITDSSAISGGEILNPSDIKIKERGVCWSTSQKPTTASSKSSDGTGFGKFTSTLTGLKPNTKYYIRAYAIANAGATFYGDEKSFTTSPQ
ncbi:MAG: carboxypeptidase regulatory-like domain-containing protein [Bacteroidetes bacterium]|nr:carboxypeptidase regulatory-like domain-containing protein [Bacteroidota bacterium]